MISARKSKRKSTSTSSDPNKPSETISFDAGWNKVSKIGVQPYLDRIENVIDKGILSKVSITKEQFIETYGTIYTMSVQREPNNHSGALYKHHSIALTKYYKHKFEPILTKISSSKQTDIEILKEWSKRWKCHEWAVKGMTRLFQYLNRFHVPNTDDLLDTTQQGYELYRSVIYEKFKDNITKSILNCIKNERNGIEQDRELLRECIHIYVNLGNHLKRSQIDDDFKIYVNDFHNNLIKETKQYYKQQSRIKLDNLSAPEYLIYANDIINNEIIRLNVYIDKHSENELMCTVRNELLTNHLNELLIQKSSGINSILQRTIGVDSQSACEDLKRLHNLYSKVPFDSGNKIISEVIKKHIIDLGLGFIKKSFENIKDKENAAHQLIQSLINLHDRFLNIVQIQFNNEAVYHKILKEAFEVFINKEYTTSGILARYANDLLKRGSKLANSSNIDTIMKHVVMLYGYIRDKDIFEKDYQLYLSSRLLQDLSESEQLERIMIGKLKTECGYHWTKKLEDMFKDIQRSKELMLEYNKTDNSSRSSIDLNVSICTTGAWPTASIQPIKNPNEIQEISESFSKYYLNKFNGRKLKFQMNKGKADISVIFNSKKRIKKILVVSTYQMIILMLFNNKQTWTFIDIQNATGIPKEDLISALISMAHPKIKILRKSPNRKDINDMDKFQINPNYNNPRQRVIVPTIHFGPYVDPNIDPKILVTRKHQIDAAVVRIMKARQRLNHNDLIAEVVKQLQARFKPKPLGIKKRILTLIELEYLERDENQRALYHYKQ